PFSLPEIPLPAKTRRRPDPGPCPHPPPPLAIACCSALFHGLRTAMTTTKFGHGHYPTRRLPHFRRIPAASGPHRQTAHPPQRFAVFARGRLRSRGDQQAEPERSGGFRQHAI